MKTNALVVSGGGSKGAFAVGAADVLHRELGLEFSIYAGTSTGALMAPLLAQRGAAAIDTLRTLYTSVHTRDILKRRDPPERILRSPSINQTEPLLEIIEENITDAVANDLLDPNAERQLILTTVDLTTGKLVYHYTGPELSPGSGEAVRLTSRNSIIQATLASATIPVFMPPVSIAGAAGPHRHVDGGVREYAPISVTIDAGATDLY